MKARKIVLVAIDGTFMKRRFGSQQEAKAYLESLPYFLSLDGNWSIEIQRGTYREISEGKPRGRARKQYFTLEAGVSSQAGQ